MKGGVETQDKLIESPLLSVPEYSAGAHVAAWRGVQAAEHFGAPAAEYEAARSAAGLFDRCDRGRIVASGADRKTWLHNLVTNAVTNLGDLSGVYAFAVNAKGRILFDVNIVALPDALWLDVAREAAGAAFAHLDRYIIMEDVRLEVVSDGDARLGCSGPQAGAVAAALGIADLEAMRPLQMRELGGGGWLLRHDFAGAVGFELIVPREQGAGWWRRLVAAGARPAGWRALEALRIEAGIPALSDLADNVLPAETGRRAAGVSDDKGCYLGYEMVERMRSRGILAKRLVRVRLGEGAGVRLREGAGVRLAADVVQGGQRIGRLTSLVQHPARAEWVGLGYVKTPVTNFAGAMVGEAGQAVSIEELAG